MPDSRDEEKAAYWLAISSMDGETDGQLFKLSVGHKVIDNSGLEPSLPEHA